ncbi:MAG TPA: PBSX family phage terminase large subunit [Candidatus Omnitrophota bacterium]|nr:PBSX family phage terminase large subunit [Candidatus Omnitrophota bacterium]
MMTLTEVINPSNIDAYLSAARWWDHLKRTSNAAFIPLYGDKHRYLILCGGGGSGKSIFAGRKVLERATTESGHRILVCRKVKNTIRESCYNQLLSQLSSDYPDTQYTKNKTDMTITFPNDSVILFSGLDDVEKMKSIHRITSIWVEEASELLESDFNQLDIRMRGETKYYKQIIVTFNPVSILHWLKTRFFDAADPRAATHRSTYRDNRFLDADAIKTLESFKNTDEYYYTVYCLGEWGTTGKSVFNAKSVTEQLQKHIQPVGIGMFSYFETPGGSISNILFNADTQGYVKIYEYPITGHPYVIGGDTAGDGSDSFVGQVIDNTTGRQVAVLRHTFDEDLYACQMYCLGMYYNGALIGIETNYSTYPVMRLEAMQYPHQYMRESVDDYTHQIKKSFGFRTDSKTRPVAIAGLIQAVRDDVGIVSDATTLEEMLTFVRDKTYKPVAEEGAHDDCIMSLAIAHYIRPQQSYLPTAPARKRVKWEKDMLEDYNNSTPEIQKILIEKWGYPE